MGEFARSAYDDHSFPKSSTDYDELSSYLELNGHYLSSMTVFDEAWELYQNMREKIKDPNDESFGSFYFP